MIFIRSLLFSFFMILSTMLTAVSLVLLSPLPYRWVVVFSRLYPASIMLALKYICGLHYEVIGRENIPAQTSIIFCKHQSTWETLAIQVIFPPMAFVVKRELLWVPFFGWGLAALRAIAINRSAGRSAMKQLVDKGIDRLKQGIWMAIFPEGTRVAAGSKGRYHIGGAILAAKSGYPVVPVAHNAGEFWPRGQFLKKPGTIKLVIGPQIPSNNRKPEDILADAKNWIESTVAEISAGTAQKD
ncbi:Acyl-CoA:1-acyl-sn-glycerol-3-phosphate acyltransferase [hydrothermal vent metagenome]|uniref:Acyl-CoA:1-acyl-sn-glycerol-3-phosphate acyltransferase n=1 Tax=hydrothermal vent metagenome TaxID=652676 RepID=A0A3B1C8S7_9ZZZZ